MRLLQFFVLPSLSLGKGNVVSFGGASYTENDFVQFIIRGIHNQFTAFAQWRPIIVKFIVFFVH